MPCEAYKTIDNFIEVRLPKLIDNINERNKQKIYSVDYVFFPLFVGSFPIENIADINTKSGYVDNRIIHTLQLSKEFPTIIEDLERQFMSTIQMNKEIAFNKLNSLTVQNQNYIENMTNFIVFAREELLRKSIKSYMRALISARVALNTLRDWGITYWRLKFEAHFKYFRSKDDLEIFRKETYNRIDRFLENKINDEMRETESLYNSP